MAGWVAGASGQCSRSGNAGAAMVTDWLPCPVLPGPAWPCVAAARALIPTNQVSRHWQACYSTDSKYLVLHVVLDVFEAAAAAVLNSQGSKLLLLFLNNILLLLPTHFQQLGQSTAKQATIDETCYRHRIILKVTESGTVSANFAPLCSWSRTGQLAGRFIQARRDEANCTGPTRTI